MVGIIHPDQQEEAFEWDVPTELIEKKFTFDIPRNNQPALAIWEEDDYQCWIPTHLIKTL